MPERFDIVMIGAGNVATHLAKAFFSAGYHIKAVYSQTSENAKQLADLVQARPVHDWKDLPSTADLFVIALKDDVLKHLKDKIQVLNGHVVHTSGTLGLDVLQPLSTSIGVFYPLQTFSKAKMVDFAEIPFIIITEDAVLKERLQQICSAIGADFHVLTESQKAHLHISAILGNNFVNYLWRKSFEYLENQGIDRKILFPLLKETLEKALLHGPENVQTGPASRGDIEVVHRHFEMLQKENPALAEMYMLLSDRILKNV